MCCVQLGMYNEESLQRLDLILAEAGKNGVRIIFPFVNYWDDLGGMQWYVDQVSMLPAQGALICFSQPVRERLQPHTIYSLQAPSKPTALHSWPEMLGGSCKNSPGVLLTSTMMHCLKTHPQCVLLSAQPPLSAMLRRLVYQSTFCERGAALQVLGKKGQDLESFYMYPSVITVTILTHLCAGRTGTILEMP